MLNLLIIVAAIILLVSLLNCENKENRRGLLLTKTLLSSLFILAVLVQNHSIPIYFYSLLVGLILCRAVMFFWPYLKKECSFWV